MTPPAPDQIDDTESPGGWERALLDGQLAMLGRLAEAGLDLALALKDQAIPDRLTEAGAPAEIAMAFSRVSRAVRMTLALQSRLVRDFKTPLKAASAQDEEKPYDGPFRVMWLGQEEQEAEQRRRVQNSVRGLAEDAALDSETVERLTAEAGERLERDDIYDDILTRPFDELVAMICKDLGLAHPSPSMGEGPGMGVDPPGFQGMELEADRLHRQPSDVSESTPLQPFPHQEGWERATSSPPFDGSP